MNNIQSVDNWMGEFAIAIIRVDSDEVPDVYIKAKADLLKLIEGELDLTPKQHAALKQLFGGGDE